MRDTHHYTMTLSARDAEIAKALAMGADVAWGSAREPDGRWLITIRRARRLRVGIRDVPSDEDLVLLAAEEERIAQHAAPIDYDGPPVGGREEQELAPEVGR